MSSHPPTFLITKEYRRFAEFCDACRRDAYVGVCHGAPGVGKTLSARHYARWEEVEPVVLHWQTTLEPAVPSGLAGCRTVVYTPTVMTTPRRLTDALTTLCRVFGAVVAAAAQPDDEAALPPAPPRVVELLIVDEADRLKEPTLEQLRDLYDRTNQQRRMGLVLIGLPGIEKRLARYPQLYSRVGFVHHYRPLREEELHFILAHKWRGSAWRFRRTTTRTPRRWRRSRGSPAATSGWCSGCSPRSPASWRSTPCGRSPRRSSRRPAKGW